MRSPLRRDADAPTTADGGARRTALLGTLGVVGQAVGVVGWFLAGLVQDGYDAARQDLGELTAIGSTAPWIRGVTAAIAGVLTVALAVGVLRTLAPGLRSLLGVALLALHGVGTAVAAALPVDCWSTDLACRARFVTEAHTWHHDAHGTVDTIAILALVVAPYALSRPFGDDEAWRRWSTPCVALGMSLILLLVLYGAAPEAAGLTHRIIALVAAAFLASLGLRVRQLSGRPRPPRPPRRPRQRPRSLWPRPDPRRRFAA